MLLRTPFSCFLFTKGSTTPNSPPFPLPELWKHNAQLTGKAIMQFSLVLMTYSFNTRLKEEDHMKQFLLGVLWKNGTRDILQ